MIYIIIKSVTLATHKFLIITITTRQNSPNNNDNNNPNNNDNNNDKTALTITTLTITIIPKQQTVKTI